ncbi:hypothetical protein P886_0707 [Alteromonadaceae bacterium 2753L.S.0a.02]|nr:hypothetical protein P886_0707 [Alteromonadaceae bacterium 2753L.S.0a.02]
MSTYEVYISRSMTASQANGERWINISGLQTMLDNLSESSIKVNVFDPGEIDIPEMYYEKRYNLCINMILKSNLLIADLSSRSGIGVGAELMLAKQKAIPIFAVCPEHSYYRTMRTTKPNTNSEWQHPFVFGLVDKLFSDYRDCTEFSKAFFLNGGVL